METQTILIVVLGGLVVVLAGLLAVRIRAEREHLAALKRMNLSEFSEFLRTNSVRGTIAEVAGKVSDLLKTAFGCDRILFLRKKRRWLEVNYFHGLGRFDRREFRTAAASRLLEEISRDFLPRSIEVLRPTLPEELYSRLRKRDLGLFFPIFWRDNLYGVYFVRSTIETRSPSFNVMVASLAQSLSAAYHIKWHESRYQLARNQLERARSTPEHPRDRTGFQDSLLKLVTHRNSQTLLPRLIESIRKDLGLNRVAYLYHPNGAAVPQMIQEGLQRSVQVPDRAVLETLFRSLEGSRVYTLSELLKQRPALKRVIASLQKSGLEHITAFSGSRGRPGVLAWGGGRAAKLRPEEVDMVRSHAKDLLSNVEYYERMEELSQTDGLTGLANQRYFRRRLDEEIQRAQRYRRKLGLIIIDLDSLKQTNDTLGHLAGDAVIRQMGRILRNNIRSIDIIARYGGDEFCVIMPESDETQCSGFMERLKGEVSRARFVVEGGVEPLSCTISLGGAVYPDQAESPRKLIFAADMALLKAKEQGRNQWVLYSDAIAQSK